jgi:hypothetical protein
MRRNPRRSPSPKNRPRLASRGRLDLTVSDLGLKELKNIAEPVRVYLLHDAEAGSHLWAERFDKPVADLFDMQDEIVGRLAGQLRAKPFTCRSSAPRRDARNRPPNPDSMDRCFQGAAWFYKGPTPDICGIASHARQHRASVRAANENSSVCGRSRPRRG